MSGTITPEFSLLLAVYDLDGRPEQSVGRDIYALIDQTKLATVTRGESKSA